MFFGLSPKTNAVSLTRLLVTRATYGSRYSNFGSPEDSRPRGPPGPPTGTLSCPPTEPHFRQAQRASSCFEVPGTRKPRGTSDASLRPCYVARLANLETSAARTNGSPVSRACAAARTNGRLVPRARATSVKYLVRTKRGAVRAPLGQGFLKII